MIRPREAISAVSEINVRKTEILPLPNEYFDRAVALSDAAGIGYRLPKRLIDA